MAGATVGEVKLSLGFDGSSVSKSADKISKDIGDKLAGVAKTIGKTFTIATAAAAAGVAGITTAGVKLYSDYEQLTGGIETLFKNAYDDVMDNANKAFMTAGLSANDYMETVTSFSASLLQGLSGDTVAAAKVADMAMVDMSDNANKMGTDISRIQDAYQGFAKQNYTMLDNLKLGYGGTASEMARLINDSGVLGDSMTVTAKTVNDVSFDKMIEAIHKVQTDLDITGTTAKEAATTIQGSLGSMKASWTNLLTGMADESQDVKPLIENLASTAGTFVENLLPVVETALNSVADLISGVAPKVIEALPSLVATIAPAIINAAISIVNSLSAQLPSLVETSINTLISCLPDLFDGAVQLFMAIVDALPVVIDALTAALPKMLDTLVRTLTSPSFLTQLLNAAITLLMAIVNALPKIITALIDALPVIIDNIISFLTNPGTIGMLLNAAVQLFFALVQAVPQILGSLLGALGSILNSVFGRVGEFFGTIFGALTEWLGSLLTPIGEFFGSVFAKIGEFVGFLGGVMGNIFNVVTAPIQAIWGFIQNIFILIAAVLATVAEWVYNTVLAPIINFVTEAINTIVSGVTGFVSAVQTVIGGIVNWTNSNVIQPIANFFSGLWSGVQAGVNAFASVFRSVFEGIKNFISGIVNGIKGFFEGLWNGIKTGVEAVKGAISNVFSAIGGIIKAPINGIISAINGVINTINGITVPDWVPVIGGAHTNFPTIPMLAQGGFVNGATQAIIGEAGAEAVLPLEQNTDNWSGLLADTLLDAMEERENTPVGNRSIIINITNAQNLDEHQLSDLMLRKLREIA